MSGSIIFNACEKKKVLIHQKQPYTTTYYILVLYTLIRKKKVYIYLMILVFPLFFFCLHLDYRKYKKWGWNVVLFGSRIMCVCICFFFYKLLLNHCVRVLWITHTHTRRERYYLKLNLINYFGLSKLFNIFVCKDYNGVLCLDWKKKYFEILVLRYKFV